MIFAALLLMLVIQANSESCHTSVVPLPAVREMAPVYGIPVLVDGAAVSLHCKF